MQQWKPDTCNCVIFYDKDFNVDNKTVSCPAHSELKGQDLLNFVISENQASNEFYKTWTKEDFEDPDAMQLIIEYKKAFVEVPNIETIRNLSFSASKKLFRG